MEETIIFLKGYWEIPPKISGTAKTTEKKNHARRAMGKKTKQMLSAIHVLCLNFQKILAQAIAPE